MYRLNDRMWILSIHECVCVMYACVRAYVCVSHPMRAFAGDTRVHPPAALAQFWSDPARTAGGARRWWDFSSRVSSAAGSWWWCCCWWWCWWQRRRRPRATTTARQAQQQQQQQPQRGADVIGSAAGRRGSGGSGSGSASGSASGRASANGGPNKGRTGRDVYRSAELGAGPASFLRRLRGATA